MTTTTVRLLSEKQADLIARLYAERDHDIAAIHTIAADAAAGTASMSAASTAIDILFNLPRKAVVHADGGAIAEGYFWVEGLIYKVQAAKSSGNLYAKVFTDSGYEYAPGAMRLLANAERLTVEQAAEMGVKTGRCVVCARLLTDADSVARGIGPVCEARL